MIQAMQYFKPEGDLFVGDCMPFFHEGTFHLFYLLDQGHHQGRGGLGGHQWAHASTRDLVHWQHHPLALALTEDWEGSICTGSVLHHGGLFHAFYATRKTDWTQHLSHAVSADGLRFQKTTPNPFSSAPAGFSSLDYRDPFVFADGAGRFQMLVTSRLERFPLHERGGCLLRLTSSDLSEWAPAGPLLVPGAHAGYACVPECPDWFAWNGFHYLLFGLGLQTHYRFSRGPFGPWLCPALDTLDGTLAAVMKTARFGADRRIGACWVGPREGNKDAGRMRWGGQVVFRELIQHEDGTLGTRFPPEMVPASGRHADPTFSALTPGASGGPGRVQLHARETQDVAALRDVPVNCRIRCRVAPEAGSRHFGLGLRGSGNYETKYDLAFEPSALRLALARESLAPVQGLDRPFDLEVLLKDDLVDVCVGQRQCLINRLPELTGRSLFFFCQNGSVVFEALDVAELA